MRVASRLIVWATVGLVVAPPSRADVYRQILVSLEEGNNPARIEMRGVEITPGCPDAWVLTKTRLQGGKQTGVEVVTLDNGKIKLNIVPTRGLGIWSIERGKWRIGWDSPVKEIVHPQFVNLTSRGGLGWLDGFGEWLCRCGLENNGHPGRDRIIDNTGAESTVDLTLHGKMAYLPAQEYEFSVERQSPFRLRLVGRVYERMMHGPKLLLESELTTIPGSEEFQLREDVVNLGGTPTEFQLLYHINFGQPLLEEGARVLAPFARVAPMNAHAAKSDLDHFAEFQSPTPGYVEEVFCTRLYADENGQTAVLLRNREGDRGVALRYSLAALPYLTLWKNTAAVEDGYVTGIEPGTNFPYNRRLERQAGRVPKLDVGGRHHIELTVAIHDTQRGINAETARIEAIRAGRPTEQSRDVEIDVQQAGE